MTKVTYELNKNKLDMAPRNRNLKVAAFSNIFVN